MSANYDQMLYSIGHMVYTIIPNGRRYSYRNPILVHSKAQFMTMLQWAEHSNHGSLSKQNVHPHNTAEDYYPCNCPTVMCPTCVSSLQ